MRRIVESPAQLFSVERHQTIHGAGVNSVIKFGKSLNSLHAE